MTHIRGDPIDLSNWLTITCDQDSVEGYNDLEDEYVVVGDLEQDNLVELATVKALDDNRLCSDGQHNVQSAISSKTFRPPAHRRRKSANTEEMSQWVFRHSSYRLWQEDAQRPMLCLNGIAGSGKSTLASVVLERLRRDAYPKTAIAGYFFDGRYKDEKNIALHVLEVILEELTRLTISQCDLRYRTFEQLTLGLRKYRSKGDRAPRLSASQLRCFVGDIIHEIRAEETLILILDGLDDVEDEHERQLLYELLAVLKLRRPPHLVKTFVCSRPLNSCGDLLADQLRIDIEREVEAHDARAIYIRRKMLEIQRNQQLSVQEPKNWKVGAEAQTFLQAKSLYQTLDNSETILAGVESRIAILLSTPFRIAYRYQLDTIESKDRRTAETALKWVTYAARPMYIYELLEVLQLDLGVEVPSYDISRLCGNLLIVDEDETVKFVHLSVRDFLLQVFELDRSSGSSPTQSFKATNERLAHICLRALESPDLLSSLPLTQHSQFRDAASKQGKRFKNYARECWRFHYKFAEDHSSWLPGFLSSKLRESFQHQFSVFWQEFVSLQDEAYKEGQASKRISPKILRSLSLRIGLRFGFVELVKLELAMGADCAVNACILDYLAALPTGSISTGRRESLLHMAAYNDSPILVELLLQRGAELDARDRYGYTALHYAAAHGNTKTIELLLAHKSLDIKQAPIMKSFNTMALSWSYTVSPHSTKCSKCREIHVYYIFTKVLEVDEDPKKYPPFQVTSGPGATSELDLSQYDIVDATQIPSALRERLERTERDWTIKWLPGADMYTTLRMAAKRGLDDLNKLLRAAGNDFDLDALMQKLSISRQR